jgi:hypothetical protein
MSLEHEIKGHVDAILAGNHPFDPSTGDWNGGTTPEELLFHSKVEEGDANYAAERGWFDQAVIRVQRAIDFYDAYETAEKTRMPDLSH